MDNSLLKWDGELGSHRIVCRSNLLSVVCLSLVFSFLSSLSFEVCCSACHSGHLELRCSGFAQNTEHIAHNPVAIFFLVQREKAMACIDEDVAENPCVFLPLEESVRLTDDQVIYRGEFIPTVQSGRPNAALMVLLPVAASRVRLVAFDIVVDMHEGSDIETSPS